MIIPLPVLCSCRDTGSGIYGGAGEWAPGTNGQGVDNRFIFTLELLGLGSLGNQSQFFGRAQFGEPLR